MTDMADELVELIIDCTKKTEELKPFDDNKRIVWQATRDEKIRVDWNEAIKENKRFDALKLITTKAKTDPAFSALLELMG